MIAGGFTGITVAALTVELALARRPAAFAHEQKGKSGHTNACGQTR
jgi:hypothetical protein